MSCMQQIFYIHYANRYEPPLQRMFGGTNGRWPNGKAIANPPNPAPNLAPLHWMFGGTNCRWPNIQRNGGCSVDLQSTEECVYEFVILLR